MATLLVATAGSMEIVAIAGGATLSHGIQAVNRTPPQVAYSPRPTTLAGCVMRIRIRCDTGRRRHNDIDYDEDW